ncbi:MAG: hypothetical protein QW175_07580 [Candidatus Bathyarchaeia archaeon]
MELVKRTSAEQQAERYFGKIVLLLSEEKAIELPFLAKLLYVPYGKLYFWLVKKRLWNDCIRVEKRAGKLWVSLEGPRKCWLAAVFSLIEPEPKPEFGNEIFKRMVSIGDGYKRAIFAHMLEDNTVLICTFDNLNKKFLLHLQLKPEEAISNGSIFVNLSNERFNKVLLEEASNSLGLKSAKPSWSFETIHVVTINAEFLERALKEKVVVVSEEQS